MADGELSSAEDDERDSESTGARPTTAALFVAICCSDYDDKDEDDTDDGEEDDDDWGEEEDEDDDSGDDEDDDDGDDKGELSLSRLFGLVS